MRRLVDESAAHLVVLQGPAGLGKSTLLDGIARHVGAARVARFSGEELTDSASAATRPNTDDDVTLLVDDVDNPHSADTALRLGRRYDARVVMASRLSPTWVSTEHVLDGRTQVLSTEDLLFTTDEVRDLAAEADLDLSPGELSELQEATDGWPALVDAALRARLPHAELTPRRLDELIDKFVREEILDTLAADERELLSDAAAVPSFDASILGCLLRDSHEPVDPIRLIDRWAASGWLIHGNRSAHWRMPEPMRRNLMAELDVKRPGRRAELVAGAVQLLVSSERTAEALPCIMDASLDQAIAAAIRQTWLPALARGNITELIPAVNTLPDDVITADPALLLLAAVSALRASPDISKFSFRLAQAETVIDKTSLNGPLLTFHALKMLMARIHGDIDKAREFERACRTYLDDATDEQRYEHAGPRAYFNHQVGASRLAEGDLEAAATALRSAATIAGHKDTGWHATVSETLLAYTTLIGGDLATANRRVRSAIANTLDNGWSEYSFTHHQHLTLGLIELECGRTAQVSHMLQEAQLRLARDAEPPAARLGMAWSVLGLLRQDTSQAEHAMLLTGAEYATNRLPFNRLLAVVARAQARLVHDEPKAALLELADATAPSGQGAVLPITRARAYLALDEPLRAEGELSTLGAEEEVMSLTTRADLKAIRLECALRQGQDGQQLFLQLLALLQRTGSRRPILLLPHLRDAVASGRLAPPPSGRMSTLAVETAALHRANSEGLPPLSDREIQVLTALTDSSTLSTIAKNLFVSSNTLKTTSRGIYRKLGAAGRYEAVSVARALGMLPSPSPMP